MGCSPRFKHTESTGAKDTCGSETSTKGASNVKLSNDTVTCGRTSRRTHARSRTGTPGASGNHWTRQRHTPRARKHPACPIHVCQAHSASPFGRSRRYSPRIGDRPSHIDARAILECFGAGACELEHEEECARRELQARGASALATSRYLFPLPERFKLLLERVHRAKEVEYTHEECLQIGIDGFRQTPSYPD